MENTTVEFFSNTPPSQKLRTFRETNARIKALEAQLGLPTGKPIVHIWRANERVSELEAMTARAAAPKIAPPTISAPSLSALTGRDRFLASVAAAAARKPAAQSHPGLSGRERFAADVRLDAMPQNLSAAGSPENSGAKSEKTGRARFAAAVKKSN